jgi:hypothetical protein
MTRQSLWVVLALAGLVALLLSAFANPLSIGEDGVFGWLQWTGVIVGAVALTLGVVMAWVPMHRRSQTPTHA